MRGHWKLWHDVRGRFLVACVVVGWQIYSSASVIPGAYMFGNPGALKPGVCRYAHRDEPTIGQTVQQMNKEFGLQTAALQEHTKIAIHDYLVQARYCGLNQRPTENYGMAITKWVDAYTDGVWMGLMPILMLFMGILISVGPPFSGESNESATLTFSLPWSRGRWLKERVKMSAGLVLLLVAPAYMASYAITNVPHIGISSGMSFVQPLQIESTVRAIVCGFIGIALGVSATMLTRNALIGAVAAAISGYLLMMFNVATLFPSLRHVDVELTLLEFGKPGGTFVAFAVIIGAIALCYVRLTQTDF